MVASVLLITFLSISWLGIGMLIEGLELLPWGPVLGLYYIGSAVIVLFCLVSAFFRVRHDWVDLDKGFRRRRAWLLNGSVVLLIEGLVTVLLYLPIDRSILVHGLIDTALSLICIPVLLVAD